MINMSSDTCVMLLGLFSRVVSFIIKVLWSRNRGDSCLFRCASADANANSHDGKLARLIHTCLAATARGVRIDRREFQGDAQSLQNLNGVARHWDAPLRSATRCLQLPAAHAPAQCPATPPPAITRARFRSCRWVAPSSNVVGCYRAGKTADASARDALT